MKNLWLKIIRPTGGVAKWLIFVSLLAILVLGTLGYLDSLRQYLDTEQLTFNLGAYQISVYEVLRALLSVAVIFWIAAIISDLAENRIGGLKLISTANRTLALKITQIAIYIIAALVTLDFMGIDLTTLTVFGGALGIGLGFGLQKIASNFVSGLILLFEKSVEEGDLVELADGTFGFIRRPSARFTLIETFDGKEILVPNEDLITSRVTNWTYSNPRGRIEVTLGVSYKSDIKLARELMLTAAREHPRCIADPEPKCFLVNFGDSSVDFILHFWVGDVTQGRWEPKSEVMYAIWDKFRDNGIEIPFPQRDLHVRSDLRDLDEQQ